MGINKGNNIKEKVSCGDTEFCEDCSLEEASKKDPKITKAEFSKNAMGRCDYYNGPDKVITHITRNS